MEQLIIIPKAPAFKWGLAAPLPRVLRYPVVHTYLIKSVEIHLGESRQNVVMGPTFGSSLCQSVDQKHQTPHLPGCEETALGGSWMWEERGNWDSSGDWSYFLSVCCTGLQALTSPVDTGVSSLHAVTP